MIDPKTFADRIIAGPQPLVVTGPDRGECTAVAHKWSLENGYPIIYGDAIDTYANAPATFYTRVPYRAGMVAPSGAIAVWHGNKTIGTTDDGHTAVTLPGGNERTFLSVDQNWPVGAKVREVRHTYIGLTGFIVFNNIGGSMAATKEQLIELYKLVFPNQPVNDNWVAEFVGKDMSDVLQVLRDDPSRQSYITGLVNGAANAAAPNVVINGVKYAPAKE